MDEHQALFLDLFLRVGQRLVEGITVQHHPATPGAYRLDLDLGGGFRHHDSGLDPHVPGGKGQALGMVARRSGDHATGALFIAQLYQLVVGTADLEGEHRLQVFALEQHGIVQPLGEKVGPMDGCFHRHIVDRGTENLLYVAFQSRHQVFGLVI